MELLRGRGFSADTTGHNDSRKWTGERNDESGGLDTLQR